MIEIKLGGKTYLLRMTMGSARAAQELLKRPFAEIVQALSKFDMDAIRIMFFAALRAEQPSITLDETDRMLDSPGLELRGLTEALARAIADFFGPGESSEIQKKLARTRKDS